MKFSLRHKTKILFGASLLAVAACSNPLDDHTTIIDKNSPTVTGLADDLTPVRSRTWTWGCSLSDTSLCEYRFAISTGATHVFSGESFGTDTTATQGAGDGLYYIHVQVRNRDDHSLTSRVYSHSAFLDNTAPVLQTVSPPANGTYSVTHQLSFTVTFNEPVTVTGVPRLALTIGSTNRQALYVSGSNSRHLVFRYEIQTGEMDLDGIAFASTAIDLNGGSIRDVVAFDAPLSFTALAPNLSGVRVDTTQPVFTPDPSLWAWSLTSPASGSYSTDTTPQIALSGAAGANGSTVQVYGDAACTQVAGGSQTIAGGTAAFADISYASNGTQDGAKTYYAIATYGGLSSACTNLARHYFLDTVNPNAPGAPTHLTPWVTNLTTSPLFTWTTPVDPGGAAASGILRIEAGVSTAPAGGNSVAGWTTLGAGAVSHSYSGLSLTACTPYYPSLRAVDQTGNTSVIATAPSFRADATAPSAPAFSLGSDANLTRTPTLTIGTPSTDNCSFQGYDIAISRDADADGILDSGELANTLGWTDIGNVPSYQRTGLSLTGGQRYFVSLRAKDAAGNFSTRVDSAGWFGQYCEGTSGSLGYYSYATGALSTLSDVFVKAAQPGWANHDYVSVNSVANITAATTVTARPQGDYYGLAFLGRIEITAAATYTFFTSSDDGSDVFIGNTRVVNNDGLHGVTEASGNIALTPGCYDLQVRFFENAGGDEITLRWQSPAIAKAVVPSSVLFPKRVPMPQIDWHFDTGSGTVATDSSMHGFNGTLTGSPSWSTASRCTNASARSLSFNGSTQYVSSSTLTGVDVLQNNFSTSFWTRFTSGTAGMVLMDLGGAFQITTGPAGGTLGFGAGGGVGSAVYSAAGFNDGNWHHVTAIRRGSNLKLFVDGTQVITTTVTNAATTFNNLTLARSGAGANYFAGDLDQVKVWNEALDNAATSSAVVELRDNPCR